jgi:MFS family permease
LQIAGIMAGMIFLGFFADRLGRKLGSIITASIMLLGGIMLTASDGPTQSGIVLKYTISQVRIPPTESISPLGGNRSLKGGLSFRSPHTASTCQRSEA